MSVDSPSNVQVPAPTTSNQQINRQWKADDGNINAYTFNPNNEQIGLNPDYFYLNVIPKRNYYYFFFTIELN